ncbi:MAG: hypothetical protein K2W96_21480 [Gemmataceae bacterium]|nr:hypothetical protein [Gemmataceae bacterium]
MIAALLLLAAPAPFLGPPQLARMRGEWVASTRNGADVSREDLRLRISGGKLLLWTRFDPRRSELALAADRDGVRALGFGIEEKHAARAVLTLTGASLILQLTPGTPADGPVRAALTLADGTWVFRRAGP